MSYMRIAAVEQSQCKPEKCGDLCIRVCPVERAKPETIIIESTTKKAKIDENLCIGCGICVNKCPFSAISVLNVPDSWSATIVHKYFTSGFLLFWLPTPRKGSVLGIIGKNGAGKTTALKILTGEIVPNFGESASDRSSVISYFRGKELQRYFMDLYSSKIKVAIKPQYLDHFKTEILLSEYLAEVKGSLLEEFNLKHLLHRTLNQLSGGELQKAVIVKTISQDVQAYFFDEPASFLDVRERFVAGRAIRRLAQQEKYVVVIEHDLIVLDYLADYVAVIYGEAGAYGYVSNPYSTRNGINAMLMGYLPDHNVRFRSYPIIFYKRSSDSFVTSEEGFSWPEMQVQYKNGFKLVIEPGKAYGGSAVGLIGENGVGKTSFVKKIFNQFSQDYHQGRNVRISYKPQTLTPKFNGTVEELFKSQKEVFQDQVFMTDIFEPLRIHKLSQKSVQELSGGELQRVATAFALAKEAEIYLLDEPSAYLDVEERLAVSKAIRRTVENRKSVAFVVDHDLAMIDYVSDYLVLIEGEPGIRGTAHPPTTLRSGLNSFLRSLNITFRRDKDTGRPRSNKEGSYLDRHQKNIGEYFYESMIEESSEETADESV
jgi:ATP-binding cassette subfamily E protein 1